MRTAQIEGEGGFLPNKGFHEVEARPRESEKDKVVVEGMLPKSDYFITSKGSKFYPEGTEIILRGTAILHCLKSGLYVVDEADIVGKYA